MKIKVYRNRKSIIDIEIDEKTVFNKAIMADEYVEAVFTLPVYFHFEINDYIKIGENIERYELNFIPQVSKTANDQYSYKLKFESRKYLLQNALFSMMADENQSEIGNTDFFLTGDVKKFLDVIRFNVRRAGIDIISEGIVAVTDEVNLHFQHENCLSALNRICEALDCEYEYISGRKVLGGTKINIRKRIGYDREFSAFGYKRGIRQISWNAYNEQNIVTVIYAKGGDKNLPENYGKLNLEIPPIEKNVDKYGRIEMIKSFPDIYPQFKGVVTQPDGYAFYDDSITFNVSKSITSGMPAKVVFKSGDLAGYEFGISNFNFGDRRVSLNKIKDGTLTLPNENLKINKGDEYTFINILLPNEYVNKAHEDLKAKANEFVEKFCKPIYVYDIKIDERYFEKYRINLQLGDIIKVEIPETGEIKSLRIMGISHPLLNPYKYSLTLSDEINVNRFIQLTREQYNIKRMLNELKKKQRLISV